MRKRPSIGALFIAFAAFAACIGASGSQLAGELGEHIVRGHATLMGAQFEKALQLFTEAIKGKENSVEVAYVHRANCYLQMNRDLQAAQDAGEALKINAKNVTALRIRGRAYINLRKSKEALADADRLLAILPHTEDGFERKADAYEQLRQPALAKLARKQSFREIRRHNRFYKLGNMQYHEDNMKSAIHFFDQYLQEHPFDRQVLYERGKSFESLGEMDKALVDLKLCAQLEPDELNNWRSVAQVTQHIGRYGEAADAWGHLVPVMPGADEIYFGRAACYDKLRQYDKAIDDYSIICIIHPDDEDAYRYRAQCYMKLGKYQKAVDDYSASIKLDPDISQSYIGRSLAYKRLGKIAQAQQDLQTVARLKNKQTAKEGL